MFDNRESMTGGLVMPVVVKPPTTTCRTTIYHQYFVNNHAFWTNRAFSNMITCKQQPPTITTGKNQVNATEYITIEALLVVVIG